MTKHSTCVALLLINAAVGLAQTMPPPRLVPKTDKPITLSFRNVSIGQAFQMLADVTGIKALFDKNVDTNQGITVSIKQVSLEQALTELMNAAKLSYKVVDSTSIVVAGSGP